MLPFLKPKKLASVIMANSKKDGGVEPMQEEGEARPEHMSMAEELIGGVHSKDASKVAKVLQKMQEMDDASDEEQK